MDKKILKSLMTFCAYQERSENDVLNKINTLLTAKTHDVEKTALLNVNDYILELKANNYLNQKRFLKSYIRGKLCLKKWGRNKIIAGLYKHKIQVNNIDDYIDLDIYTENLKIHAERKWILLKQEKKLLPKLYRYLLNRGYTDDEIESVCENF